jgi:hypothetical protein
VDPWPAPRSGAGQGDDPVGDCGQVAIMGDDQYGAACGGGPYRLDDCPGDGDPAALAAGQPDAAFP